jgi:anti-sigma B factor antagonist
MTATTTTLEVRNVGDHAIIDITGDLTPACDAAMDDAWQQAAASGARAVILNFAGLAYMNSGGIGLLVTLLVRANRIKVPLAAVGLDAHYRQILELTRLDEAIAVHATEAAAIDALGS